MNESRTLFDYCGSIPPPPPGPVVPAVTTPAAAMVLVKADCNVAEAVAPAFQCRKTHPNEPIEIIPQANGLRKVMREEVNS